MRLQKGSCINMLEFSVMSEDCCALLHRNLSNCGIAEREEEMEDEERKKKNRVKESNKKEKKKTGRKRSLA